MGASGKLGGTVKITRDNPLERVMGIASGCVHPHIMNAACRASQRIEFWDGRESAAESY